MIAVAEKSISTTDELYDVHDGEIFNEDVTTWDEEHLTNQSYEIVNNFSRERLATHFKEVCQHMSGNKKRMQQ